MADRARILPLTRWVRVGDVEAATGLSRRAAYEHLARAAGREADLPPSWEMHDAGRGHRCIVVDELWARSLCAVEHVELCPAFNGVLSPGEVWCLVLTPEGALVVPVLLPTGLGRARARGPAN